MYLNMGSKTFICASAWPNVPLLGPQVLQMRPTWANLGQLSANLGPTWGQLGTPEAKSDCIFTMLFKVCVKIENLLPRAAQEAPRRVNLGQLGANLGQLSANFGSTWPWVPQLGVQKRHMCHYLALCASTWVNLDQRRPT